MSGGWMILISAIPFRIRVYEKIGEGVRGTLAKPLRLRAHAGTPATRFSSWAYPHFSGYPPGGGVAEACGSRTQTLDSQLTTNDDVAASAKFQLESTGVRTFHFHAKLSLILHGSLPCSLCRGPRTLCTCLLGTNQAVLSGEWFRVSMKAHSSVVPQKFKK